MKKILLVFLAGALALGGCSIFQKHPKKNKTVTEQKTTEQSDKDFHTFLVRLRKAAKTHDMNTLAGMMTQDFGYRLEPEGSGPGVFQYWDEQDLWQELDGILSEKFVPKGQYMVAPPQFADESLNYTGYRAGIRRVNGAWRFAYFVNGNG